MSNITAIGVRWRGLLLGSNPAAPPFFPALSHFQRSTDTPAQKALDLTVNDIPKARRGRPRSCLLSTLRADLKKVGMNLRTASGLEQLRIHAADRDKWEETIEHTYSA